MPKIKEAVPQSWLDTAIKSLAFCVFTMFTFFVNQLNSNIKDLTTQLRSLELHQVEEDKRISVIEVSREINMAGYQKLIADVADMKLQLTQMMARQQTISDFVSKHVK